MSQSIQIAAVLLATMLLCGCLHDYYGCQGGSGGISHDVFAGADFGGDCVDGSCGPRSNRSYASDMWRGHPGAANRHWYGDGCGELYVDEWLSDPPDHCDPCDCHGNWTGPRFCGAGGPSVGLHSLFGYRSHSCGGASGGHPRGYAGGRVSPGHVSGGEVIHGNVHGAIHSVGHGVAHGAANLDAMIQGEPLGHGEFIVPGSTVVHEGPPPSDGGVIPPGTVIPQGQPILPGTVIPPTPIPVEEVAPPPAPTPTPAPSDLPGPATASARKQRPSKTTVRTETRVGRRRTPPSRRTSHHQSKSGSTR